MMRTIVLSFFVLTLTFGAVRAEPPITREKVVRKNPETEAKRALARGDRRLMAVYGYTTEVPGTYMDYYEAARRFETVIIEGTSDACFDTRDCRLNENARAYATRYNRYILKHAPSP